MMVSLVRLIFLGFWGAERGEEVREVRAVSIEGSERVKKVMNKTEKKKKTLPWIRPATAKKDSKTVVLLCVLTDRIQVDQQSVFLPARYDGERAAEVSGVY